MIEARWNSSVKDDRANFYYSSSLASAADNVNTIYFYNYVRGNLADIPNLGTHKRVYVSVFSGSTGGFYSNQGGGDGDDVAPSEIPVSGTTGSIQILSADGDGGSNANVRTSYPTVVTGGIVSTGIYSASFAFTGATLLESIYDVWWTGSNQTANAVNADIQFFTGAISPITLAAQGRAERPSYYLSLTNLRDKYRANEIARFNLYIRDKFWNPTIYTVASILHHRQLPL